MSTKKIYRLQRQKDLLWLRGAVGRNQDSPLLLRLLVDTGASYTVIPTLILERLGCNLTVYYWLSRKRCYLQARGYNKNKKITLSFDFILAF